PRFFKYFPPVFHKFVRRAAVQNYTALIKQSGIMLMQLRVRNSGCMVADSVQGQVNDCYCFSHGRLVDFRKYLRTVNRPDKLLKLNFTANSKWIKCQKRKRTIVTRLKLNVS